MNNEAEAHERAAWLYAKAAESHESAAWSWAESGELERAAEQAELAALRRQGSKRARNETVVSRDSGHEAVGPASVRRLHRHDRAPTGNWLCDNEHRVLVDFSDGGAGVREYHPPLRLGDRITDGSDSYVIVRVEARKTPQGVGLAWAELRE
jgi:hypothetical protein